MEKTTQSVAGAVRKTLALVLLLLSIVMLFFPWMHVSFSFAGKDMTLSDILEYAAPYVTKHKGTLSEVLHALSEDLAADGFSLDADQAARHLDLVSDGSVSPLDAARFTAYFSRLLRNLNEYLSRDASRSDEGESRLTAFLQNLAGKLSLASTLMWVSLTLLGLCFLLAVFGVLTDRIWPAIPYPIAVVGLVYGTVWVSERVPGKIQQAVQNLIQSLNKPLLAFGLNKLIPDQIAFIQLSRAGTVCICAAALAFLLCLFRRRKTASLTQPVS